jgi:hypothetical protein
MKRINGGYTVAGVNLWEYVPASQVTQAVGLVAPVVWEYVPAPQVTQAVGLVAPVVWEYVP